MLVMTFIPLVDRVPLVDKLLAIVTVGCVVALIGLDWWVSPFNAALAATTFDARAFFSDKLAFRMTNFPFYSPHIELLKAFFVFFIIF